MDLHKDAINDVGFIAALIGHVRARYSVEPNHICATGMSDGARMSSQLACDLSDTIAAIAPVAGIRFPEDCCPKRPVPMITPLVYVIAKS